MSYADFGFDKNLSKKIEIKRGIKDSTVHGGEIKQRTLPLTLQLKTTAQRDSMVKPPQGLMIFNKDTYRVEVYSGSTWITCWVSTSTSSSSSTTI